MATTKQGFIIPDGVTGDLIVFTDTTPKQVVLIDRKNAPLGKALPGGFIDPNETLLECAKREFLEECGVNVDRYPLQLVGVFSNPNRDPRARIISTAYTVTVPLTALEHLTALDDASSVSLYDVTDVLGNQISFAFSDHKEMIEQALLISQR